LELFNSNYLTTVDPTAAKKVLSIIGGTLSSLLGASLFENEKQDSGASASAPVPVPLLPAEAAEASNSNENVREHKTRTRASKQIAAALDALGAASLYLLEPGEPPFRIKTERFELTTQKLDTSKYCAGSGDPSQGGHFMSAAIRRVQMNTTEVETSCPHSKRSLQGLNRSEFLLQIIDYNIDIWGGQRRTLSKTMDVSFDVPVVNLSVPLVIQIDLLPEIVKSSVMPTKMGCSFWNESKGSWEAAGVFVVGLSAEFSYICGSTHLTSFSFGEELVRFLLSRCALLSLNVGCVDRSHRVRSTSPTLVCIQ
jgi:hypothetical protein